MVPAGKASTSFHLLSELGNGLYIPWRDGLDCSLCGLSVVRLEASSWLEEFVQRHDTHGLALLHTNESSKTLSIALIVGREGTLVSECPSEQCSEAASESCSDSEHSFD